MYRLMNDHRDAVIGELIRISDVPRYLELRRKMREVNVATDHGVPADVPRLLADESLAPGQAVLQAVLRAHGSA